MTGRDTQRAKVYAAEDFVRTLFDRANAHGSRSVEFFGAQLTLPSEIRFASVAAVQHYVDDVLAHIGAHRPVRVRARRGTTAAHYECMDGDATIAMPPQRASWALRELVVLHEIAHHLTNAVPPHGPEFVATLCALVGEVMGPEVGYVLRVVYAKEGVR